MTVLLKLYVCVHGLMTFIGYYCFYFGEQLMYWVYVHLQRLNVNPKLNTFITLKLQVY